MATRQCSRCSCRKLRLSVEPFGGYPWVLLACNNTASILLFLRDDLKKRNHVNREVVFNARSKWGFHLEKWLCLCIHNQDDVRSLPNSTLYYTRSVAKMYVLKSRCYSDIVSVDNMVSSRILQEKYQYVLNAVNYNFVKQVMLKFIVQTAGCSEGQRFESIFQIPAYFSLDSKMQKELKRASQQITEFSIIA